MRFENRVRALEKAAHIEDAPTYRKFIVVIEGRDPEPTPEEMATCDIFRVEFVKPSPLLCHIQRPFEVML